MSKKKNNPFLLWLLPNLVGLLMRLWFSTCRVTVHGQENIPNLKKTKEKGKETPAVTISWHYAVIFMLFFLRKYDGTLLVSASSDGDYFTALGKHFGYDAVRGSRNHKGVQGLKGLLRAIKRGRTCALVGDGSQGPPLVMQPGAILLASRSGAPILPVAWSASSYLAFRSWDRLAIPKPFAKVHFFYGKPITIPAGIKGDALEEQRQQTEQALLALYHEAWAIFDKQYHGTFITKEKE